MLNSSCARLHPKSLGCSPIFYPHGTNGVDKRGGRCQAELAGYISWAGRSGARSEGSRTCVPPHSKRRHKPNKRIKWTPILPGRCSDLLTERPRSSLLGLNTPIVPCAHVTAGFDAPAHAQGLKAIGSTISAYFYRGVCPEVVSVHLCGSRLSRVFISAPYPWDGWLHATSKTLVPQLSKTPWNATGGIYSVANQRSLPLGSTTAAE